MRDDIHKSAPVSRAWRSFMKHCAREADRQDRALASALRAISADCRKELSVPFVASLRKHAANQQQDLFPELVAPDIAVSPRGHVLGKQVHAHLERRIASGQTGAETIYGALADAIKERKDACLRQMKGHWLKHAGQDAYEAIDAAEKVLAKIPSPDIARLILSNSDSAKQLGRQPLAVHLDEDLL